MIEHRSFGVVPVRRQGDSWEFFLVQHHTGHWAFPKGHQEAGESGEQTARRELREETGIADADIDTDQGFDEEYTWLRQGEKNHKIATYYLGLVKDHSIAIQAEELSDGRWVPADEVEHVLTFAEGLNVFRQAYKYLQTKKLWT